MATALDLYANTASRNLAASTGDKVAKAINAARRSITGVNEGAFGTNKSPIATTSGNTTTSGVTQTNGAFTWTDPSTGKTITVTPAGQGGYLNAYAEAVKSANEIANQYKADLYKGLQSNNQTTNTNYDNNARQAYVDYMRKQRALPSQLQSLGVNGGATESGLLNLYNNYGNEHAANEQQRAAELAANQKNYEDTWGAYWRQLQQDLADKQQTAINNQINEYNNELTKYSASIARFTADKNGYKKAQNELKALKAGNDPLKKDKIQILEAEIARVFTKDVLDEINGKNKKSGSGGGRSYRGGGRSYGYSGGGSSSGSGDSGSSRPTYKTTTTAMDEYYKSGAIKARKQSSNTKKKSASSWSSARDR